MLDFRARAGWASPICLVTSFFGMHGCPVRARGSSSHLTTAGCTGKRAIRPRSYSPVSYVLMVWNHFRATWHVSGFPCPVAGVGQGEIPLRVPLQVSNWSGLLTVHSNHLNEGNRAYVCSMHAIFDPLPEGSKHKNRNCGRRFWTVVSPFWSRNLVCIYEVIALLPRRYVHVSRISRCTCPSTLLLLLHMVRPVLLLNEFSACFSH